MLQISRLTDYAFILLTELGQAEEDLVSGSSLAERVPLPLPTVRKVLKKLAQEGVLESHQGAHGGYALARSGDEITVADVVSAMEGPISVTLCCADDEDCEIEASCPTSQSWKMINEAIQSTLADLTLNDIRQGAKSDRLQTLVGSDGQSQRAPLQAVDDQAADDADNRRSTP
jgi:FeS assembly SUF system regulator